MWFWAVWHQRRRQEVHFFWQTSRHHPAAYLRSDYISIQTGYRKTLLSLCVVTIYLSKLGIGKLLSLRSFSLKKLERTCIAGMDVNMNLTRGLTRSHCCNHHHHSWSHRNSPPPISPPEKANADLGSMNNINDTTAAAAVKCFCGFFDWACVLLDFHWWWCWWHRHLLL